MDLLEIYDPDQRLSIAKKILAGVDVLYQIEVSDTPETFGAVEEEEDV